MKKEISITRLIILLVDLIRDGYKKISIEELELLKKNGKI
jgi:hypothetical protein